MIDLPKTIGMLSVAELSTLAVSVVNLKKNEDFNKVVSFLKGHLFLEPPMISPDENGPMKAFAHLKFREGVLFFLGFMDRIVQAYQDVLNQPKLTKELFEDSNQDGLAPFRLEDLHE